MKKEKITIKEKPKWLCCVCGKNCYGEHATFDKKWYCEDCFWEKEEKELKERKESLLVELTKIRQSHEEWVAGDLKRRKEFARAFGWNKPRRQFDYGDAELYEPTWVEIFIELGKLLSARNFMDFEGNVSELECKLEDLESKIRKEIHPNL